MEEHELKSNPDYFPYIITYYGKINHLHNPFWKKCLNFILKPFKIKLVSVFDKEPDDITGFKFRKI